MSYMPITESMFLLAESREHPMHVGGLQLFEPAPGSTAEELGEEMFEKFQSQSDIHRLFRKRPASPVGVMGTVRWTHDKEVDLEYHVRRTVLPRPGRVRELLRYVSANHGALLDRHRPMWEVHLIEGLDDGRVAMYTKIHHSLVDGVSALKLLEKTLSPDPDARAARAPWDPDLTTPRPEVSDRATPRNLFSDGLKIAGELAGFVPASARVGLRAVRDRNLMVPMQAPRTMFNVPIGGARRFAAEQWPTTRLHAVASRLDITLNDVVMAMCSGALRAYLIDQNALPDEPLIAMMPVSMHAKGDDSSEGNAITAILANLATDQPDPERRLAAVVDSTTASKQVIRELSPLQAMGYGAVIAAPLAFSTVPGFVRMTPPPFNIIISNVPGPQHDLYWNGARLAGVFPASIAMDGQALNITVATTGDMVNFGVTGARAEVPSLQRILTHLDTALEELEKLCHA